MSKKYIARGPSWAPVSVSGGERDAPSEKALEYFRDTVLAEATCPICHADGLEYVRNPAITTEGHTEVLAYALPVFIRGNVDVLTDQAVQYGMCRECGFLAAFSELIVRARYDAAVRDGKV